MNSTFIPVPESPDAVMIGRLAALHTVIDDMLDAGPLALSDAGVLASLAELERVARRLPAVRHPLVAEIDARGLADAGHVRSTAELLRQTLNLSRPEAGMWVKHATEQAGRRDLTTGEPRPPRLPAVAAAVREGTLSPEQTQTIAKTMRQVPAVVSDEQRGALEADLVGHAQDLAPEQLAAVCRHALNVLDQDGKKPSETEKQARVGLVFGQTRIDGLTPFRGIADPETKAALQAALAPLAKPVKSGPEPDTRSHATRMLHALRDLAKRMLATGSLPTMAGMPATLLLTATLEQLEARTGLVSVLGGGTIPVDDVIRMAAQMKVIPIVFSATGQALYCGQDQRLGTIAIRRTTATQDRGCVIPGCDVPIMFCELHHPTPFSEGGETSADHLAWLCPFHHHRIDGWHLQRSGGRVWCTPPPWLDPSQTPRLNTYFHSPTLITDNDHHAAASTRTNRGQLNPDRPPARTDQHRPGPKRPDQPKINTADPAEPPDLLIPHY